MGPTIQANLSFSKIRRPAKHTQDCDVISHHGSMSKDTPGSRLKSERKAQKMTQEQLARAAGITQQAVSLFERGEGETKYVVPMARQLGLSPDWIETGKGEKYAPKWELLIDLSAQPPEVQAAMRDLIDALGQGRIHPDQFVALVRAFTLPVDPRT
jgi:transcriptional regulator with XRE-family HTH domain